MSKIPHDPICDLCDNAKPHDALRKSEIYVNQYREIIKLQSIKKILYEMECMTLNVIAVASFVVEIFLIFIISLHVLGLKR